MIRFDQFMRRALYHPRLGYYRKPGNPFGRHGDFFTASQLQPLFGRIIAAEACALCPGAPVFELGPGRGEMAEYLGPNYKGIDCNDHLPPELNGFLFANEFFDALPVRLGTKHNDSFYELLVEGREFVRGPQLDALENEYVQRYWPFVPEGGRFEIALDALEWIDRIAASMRSGYALFIDYGYTTAETVRFPHGTLMSYRGHVATAAVLENPGHRDITAHVPFEALSERAVARGFELIRFETLAQLVLRGIRRNVESNVERESSLLDTPGAPQHLKTLLFGMGETFRCLLLRKIPSA